MYGSVLKSTLTLLIIAPLVGFFLPLGDPAQSFPAARSSASTDSLKDDFRLRQVEDTVTNLRRIHTSTTDAAVPFPARDLLKTLKHQLIELITNRLHSEASDASVQQFQAILIENLRRVGVIVSEPSCKIIDQTYVESGYDYGAVYDITIKRPHYCSDLIAVTTTLGVLCGSDTSLYILKYDNHAWSLILASEVNDYAEISGAQGIFDYGILWPREGGEFFVVTASVNPWCSSAWQAITYRVLRPGLTPDEPHELLTRTQSIWLIDEPPYKLDVHDQAFTLSFHDEKYLEQQNDGKDQGIDDPNSMRIIKYEVDEDSVKTKE